MRLIAMRLGTIVAAAALLTLSAPAARAGDLESPAETLYVALGVESSEANSGCDAPLVGTGDEAQVWSDDPDRAIQEAIDSASDGDTIHICAGTWELESDIEDVPNPRPINSDDQLNTNSTSLTIEGDGIDETILVSVNYGRVLSTSGPGGHVWTWVPLTVRDLTISSGSVNFDGGGIVAAGVTCERARFVNNAADSGDGGAIYSTGPVNITDCIFEGNSASESGGAIYTASDVSIAGSQFTENESVDTGGALSATCGCAIDIVNTSFTGNVSDDSGGAISFIGELNLTDVDAIENFALQGGGAIDNDSLSDDTINIVRGRFVGNHSSGIGDEGGGAILNNAGDVHAIGTLFANNHVGGSDIHYNNGGAIYAQTVDLVDSDLIANTSDDTGAVFASTSITMSGGRLEENSAKTCGGLNAMEVVVERTRFADNTAPFGWGGAICAVIADIANGEFSRNTAQVGGGAINALFVTTVNTSFVANRADVGGAIISYGGTSSSGDRFVGNSALSDGGAIFANNSLTATNSRFERNSAGRFGGAILHQTLGPWSSNITANANRFQKNIAGASAGAIAVSACVVPPRSVETRLRRANRFAGNRVLRSDRWPDVALIKGICDY